MLVTVYSQQYQSDEARWGPRKHLLFKRERENASFHAKSTKKNNYRKRPSSILMIFGILVDIYERTSEPKYGPAMTSSYGETEAGKSASPRFSAQTPDLQQAITFSFL